MADDTKKKLEDIVWQTDKCRKNLLQIISSNEYYEKRTSVIIYNPCNGKKKELGPEGLKYNYLPSNN